MNLDEIKALVERVAENRLENYAIDREWGTANLAITLGDSNVKIRVGIAAEIQTLASDLLHEGLKEFVQDVKDAAPSLYIEIVHF